MATQSPLRRPQIMTGNRKDRNGGQVMTGNRIEVKIAGRIIGLIQSLRLSDDYGLEPATSLGSINVKEYVPTLARHVLTASLVVLSRETIYRSADGQVIAPWGGDDGRLDIPVALDGLEFDIEVLAKTRDKDNGSLLCAYRDCVYGAGDTDISANRIVVTQATIYAARREGPILPHGMWQGKQSGMPSSA